MARRGHLIINIDYQLLTPCIVRSSKPGYRTAAKKKIPQFVKKKIDSLDESIDLILYFKSVIMTAVA